MGETVRLKVEVRMKRRGNACSCINDLSPQVQKFKVDDKKGSIIVGLPLQPSPAFMLHPFLDTDNDYWSHVISNKRIIITNT